MALANGQLTILKTDITVTKAATVYQGSTLLVHWQQSHTQIIADFYNQAANPQVDIWRSDVKVTDMAKSVLMSEFIALTAVKQNGMNLYMQGETIDATNANVRNGFASIFPAGTSLNNLTALAKKAATYFESLFAVSSVSPFYNIPLTAADVDAAKALP